MIAYITKYIKSARRSGLALRAARWALNFFESEISFYTTPICCPQGSPLSPRQRYVRQQSGQADNQGFSGGGFLHITRQKPAKKVTVTVFPLP